MKNNTVGSKITSIRQAQNLSVEALATNSGLTVEQLQHIEDDTVFPSLAPLLKIARALGVRLGTFLDDQEETGPAITRAASSACDKSLSFTTHDATGTHMEYHSLSGAKLNRHMEPFMITIAPTPEADYTLSSHEGEEFILVTQGSVEITYGNKNYLLSQGDSIYYDSIVPHHVHADAQADAPARILAVVYTPI